MIILKHSDVRHYMLCNLIDIEGPEFEKEHHVKVIGPHTNNKFQPRYILDTVYMLTFDSPQHETMFNLKYAEYLC